MAANVREKNMSVRSRARHLFSPTTTVRQAARTGTVSTALSHAQRGKMVEFSIPFLS